MNRDDIIKLTTAIKAVVKPKLAELEARIAAIENGTEADRLLTARIKLLEQENQALTRRLALRIPSQAPRRRA